MNHARKYLLLAGIVALALVVLSASDARGLRQYSRLKKDIDAYQEKHLNLLAENRALRREIDALSGDEKALERAARENLGLVRKTEIVFSFER